MISTGGIAENINMERMSGVLTLIKKLSKFF